MSATASAGVTDGYRSRWTNLLSFERSTPYIYIPSEFRLGVTTMGAHHSVGSVTGAVSQDMTAPETEG